MQAAQFLFAQTWYACWSVSMALLFLMPALALLTDSRPSGVELVPFVAASLPLHLMAFVAWWWTRRWHLRRDSDCRGGAWSSTSRAGRSYSGPC